MDEYGDTYGLDGVIKLWDVERLTPEQVIGQILLLIRQMDQRIQELETLVYALRAHQTPPDEEGEHQD
jgi:hypothetical protein